MERIFLNDDGLPLPCIVIKSWKSLLSPEKSGICISVCASNWNRPFELIVKSLESILKQDFPPENYEIILIDDASEDNNASDAINYLKSSYRNHTIRFYRTLYSRCHTDTHPLNVAYRMSFGKIILQSQTDIIHHGETLEAAWRHHSKMDNLWLSPLSFRKYGDSVHQRPKSLYPHELGASVKTNWIRRIQGRNELIKVIPADVDFHLTLSKTGVIFGTDWTIKTIHDDYESIPRTGGNRQIPTIWPGLGLRKPDFTWTDGECGALSDEEYNLS